MINYIWKYEGSVDETGKILTLEASGPNYMADGKMAKFCDTCDFNSKHHIVMTSSIQGEDGKWISFRTGWVKRKK
jgi:hypothetical protein